MRREQAASERFDYVGRSRRDSATTTQWNRGRPSLGKKGHSQAIKSWWGKLKGVDVPDNGDYTGDMETNAQFFANMAYEGATKMGCAVADCKQKGFTAFICEYNRY
ncbi:hypothetical protein Y032_0119g810 [Ancylostoma ceylanicum]|uniref:SCP domain-containing protein n=1 Tax=Ancylostoma ceylanicum TaxID=53326 RepID=A0A016TB57_9BILA|nr:hypothetical protein Y032_0119g810 [Ancylostoma ceylanicum]